MNLMNTAKKFALPTALALVVAGTASATTADTTFDVIYTQIKGWAEGSLGKLLSVAAFLIGMAAGIVRQSAMAVVLGLTFALIFAFGPTIIENIFGFGV